MKKRLEKAYEITDAKIQFVSLVDKAANKRTFLLTKQQDGKASFTTCGRIVKADEEHHYVTGIVYEPMTEDYHGNYMTEEEITKACYWFAKNGDKVDLQHSFEPLSDAKIVENWVAKSDEEINGQPIKKGTWLMTVEVSDPAVWDAIAKGEITGLSMGGLGNYSEEDVDLESIEKTQDTKKGLLRQLAEAFGFSVVEKGTVEEIYEKQTMADKFYDAFSALQCALARWDEWADEKVYETDEEKIREALTEFNEIITSLLSGAEPITKALSPGRPVAKEGRSMSGKNQETLRGIYDSLGAFLESVETADAVEKDAGNDSGDGEPNSGDKKSVQKKEETTMTVQEAQGVVDAAVAKAVESIDAESTSEEPVSKSEEQCAPAAATPEAIQKMVDEAVAKAVQPQVTAEQISEMVTKSVTAAVEPILRSKGLPTNLNQEDGAPVQKSQHYLHGIL